MFSIFTIGEYRKHGFIKVGEKKSNFHKSVFSILTYSEYRKHGCLKISDFWNPSFQYSPDRCLKISDFWPDPSFRYSLSKLEKKKSAISETSAFSIWPQWQDRKFHLLRSRVSVHPQNYKNLGYIFTLTVHIENPISLKWKYASEDLLMKIWCYRGN